MKRLFLILIGGLLFFYSFYLLFANIGHDSRPLSMAKEVSGLSIPKDAQVLEFREEWNRFGGDGFAFAVFRLDEGQAKSLYDQGKTKGYTSLPVGELIADDFVLSYANSARVGLFKKTSSNPDDPLNYSLSILDLENGVLIVFVTG